MKTEFDDQMIMVRIYADGIAICEDDFNEYDNSLPYYDDYKEYSIPNCIELESFVNYIEVKDKILAYRRAR